MGEDRNASMYEYGLISMRFNFRCYSITLFSINANINLYICIQIVHMQGNGSFFHYFAINIPLLSVTHAFSLPPTNGQTSDNRPPPPTQQTTTANNIGRKMSI